MRKEHQGVPPARDPEEGKRGYCFPSAAQVTAKVVELEGCGDTAFPSIVRWAHALRFIKLNLLIFYKVL